MATFLAAPLRLPPGKYLRWQTHTLRGTRAMQEDLLSLMPKNEWTRRGFVMTTLASGFALAVQPVSAQTITTDTEGLEAGEVKIPVADGEIPAYRAQPAEGNRFPVILVVQEIF